MQPAAGVEDVCFPLMLLIWNTSAVSEGEQLMHSISAVSEGNTQHAGYERYETHQQWKGCK